MKKISNKTWLMVTVIIILQLAVLVFWGNKKGNFYWDEIYSYQYAHYASDNTPEFKYVFNQDYYESYNWLDMSLLKETCTATRENGIINDSLKSVTKEVFKQGYMVLLNVCESLFFEGYITKWSGILVNLVLFVICQLFIYLLAKEVSENKWVALLSMLLFGFSGCAISTVNFVRFYVYSYILLLMATYLHVLMWKYEKWYRNIILEIISGLLIFLSYGESELAIAYGGLLIGFYSIGLLIKKRWLHFCYYSIPIGGAGLYYVYKTTDFIKAILNPGVYKNNHGQSTEFWRLQSLENLNIKNFFQRTYDYAITFMGNYLLGSVWILAAVLVVAIVLIVLAIRKKKKYSLETRDTVSLSRDKYEFFYILLGVVVGYSLFSIAFEMKHIRYYSIMYPELAIVLICGIYFLCKYLDKNKAYYIGVLSVIAMTIILTNLIPQVEYIYYYDKEATELLAEKTKEYDSVTSYGDQLTAMECIVWADENSKMMLINDNEYSYENLPDQYLYWSGAEFTQEAYDKCSEYGYDSVELLCNTYHSYIYVVSKE